MLHALTSPPTMVQPPPRYVHATACGLEWCPGDARETKAAGTKKGQKRKGKGINKGCGKTRRKGRRVDLSAAHEVDEERSETASCGQPEESNEWFLAGFPQI